MSISANKKRSFGERGRPFPNGLSDHRITNAVENELDIKGFWLNEEEPDLYLVYHASAKEEVDLGGAGYRSSSPFTVQTQTRIL